VGLVHCLLPVLWTCRQRCRQHSLRWSACSRRSNLDGSTRSGLLRDDSAIRHRRITRTFCRVVRSCCASLGDGKNWPSAHFACWNRSLSSRLLHLAVSGTRRGDFKSGDADPCRCAARGRFGGMVVCVHPRPYLLSDEITDDNTDAAPNLTHWTAFETTYRATDITTFTTHRTTV